MKLRIEAPVSLLKNAYDKSETNPRYDSNGNYLGVDTAQRSFLTVYIEAVNKGIPGYTDKELEKMTKQELITLMKNKYAFYRQEIEIIQ